MKHNQGIGLLKRIFGNNPDKDPGASVNAPESSQFQESEPTEELNGSRNTPRREVVQVILRDTMRHHGIPSDWIECRIVSTVSRTGRNGMQVTFVVKKAHEKLLAYVFAFQDSFERELQRFEPHAKDWLMSVNWQFEGRVPVGKVEMPDPKTWTGAAPADPGAALAAGGAGADAAGTDDDDVQQDLAALFAIRDAALAEGRPSGGRRGGDHPDFEPTRPGFDEPDLPRR
jgi:hypothetical protein